MMSTQYALFRFRNIDLQVNGSQYWPTPIKWKWSQYISSSVLTTVTCLAVYDAELAPFDKEKVLIDAVAEPQLLLSITLPTTAYAAENATVGYCILYIIKYA